MAQYDKIANEYISNKMKNRIREDVEYHTFVHRLLLPSLGIEGTIKIELNNILKNCRLLDLGCGAGYYTRKMKLDFGCKEIVGVDLSTTMIETARTEEQAHPLGITYHICDVQKLIPSNQKFDMVIAFYLLNYAKTSDELDRMVQVISEQLKDEDNAVFLSITWNVCKAEAIVNTDRYRKYGYACEANLPIVDGDEIKNTHFNEDGSSFSYTTFYLSPCVYEQAFQKAGFTHFQWVTIEAARDHDHYSVFLESPTTIGILAHK